MKRSLLIGAVSAALISTVAFAQQSQFGTAQEARVMLDKAVAAVKANKGRCADDVQQGRGSRDRDLYPFCFNLSDGKFVAAIEQLRGTGYQNSQGPTGSAFWP